jgi:hypothetical protein
MDGGPSDHSERRLPTVNAAAGDEILARAVVARRARAPLDGPRSVAGQRRDFRAQLHRIANASGSFARRRAARRARSRRMRSSIVGLLSFGPTMP